MIELETSTSARRRSASTCSTAPTDDLERTCEKVYAKIMPTTARLVAGGRRVQADYGMPIVNKRIAVTPIALVGGRAGAARPRAVRRAMDRAAGEVGVDFIGGFSAYVHKGITPGDAALFDSIPAALAATERVCSSVNVGHHARRHQHGRRSRCMGRIIKALGRSAPPTAGGIGCAKLVVLLQLRSRTTPSSPARTTASARPSACSTSASRARASCARRSRACASAAAGSPRRVAETIKRTAFKITRMGELVGREAARRLGTACASASSTSRSRRRRPSGDSVAEILELIGVERTGAPGTTAALALLTDAVKKGGAMASSQRRRALGRLHPRLRGRRHDRAVAARRALARQARGHDRGLLGRASTWWPCPATPRAETLAAIIADEMAIGMVNNKTTAVRIIPVPGKGAGEQVEWGGLLGEAADHAGPALRLRRVHRAAAGASRRRSCRCATRRPHAGSRHRIAVELRDVGSCAGQGRQAAAGKTVTIKMPPLPPSTDDALAADVATAAWTPGDKMGLPKGAQVALIGMDPMSTGLTVYLKVPAGWKMPLHSHLHHEYLTLVSGKATVTQGGKAARDGGRAATTSRRPRPSTSWPATRAPSACSLSDGTARPTSSG